MRLRGVIQHTQIIILLIPMFLMYHLFLYLLCGQIGSNPSNWKFMLIQRHRNRGANPLNLNKNQIVNNRQKKKDTEVCFILPWTKLTHYYSLYLNSLCSYNPLKKAYYVTHRWPNQLRYASMRIKPIYLII